MNVFDERVCRCLTVDHSQLDIYRMLNLFDCRFILHLTHAIEQPMLVYRGDLLGQHQTRCNRCITFAHTYHLVGLDPHMGGQVHLLGLAGHRYHRYQGRHGVIDVVADDQHRSVATLYKRAGHAVKSCIPDFHALGVDV